MVRPKSGSEPIRKISKVADGNSYAVTLPKDIVRELGWQEHQKVVVEKRGDEIVIRDWEK